MNSLGGTDEINHKTWISFYKERLIEMKNLHTLTVALRGEYIKKSVITAIHTQINSYKLRNLTLFLSSNCLANTGFVSNFLHHSSKLINFMIAGGIVDRLTDEHMIQLLYSCYLPQQINSIDINQSRDILPQFMSIPQNLTLKSFNFYKFESNNFLTFRVIPYLLRHFPALDQLQIPRCTKINPSETLQYIADYNLDHPQQQYLFHQLDLPNVESFDTKTFQLFQAACPQVQTVKFAPNWGPAALKSLDCFANLTDLNLKNWPFFSSNLYRRNTLQFWKESWPQLPSLESLVIPQIPCEPSSIQLFHARLPCLSSLEIDCSDAQFYLALELRVAQLLQLLAGLEQLRRFSCKAISPRAVQIDLELFRLWNSVSSQGSNTITGVTLKKFIALLRQNLDENTGNS
jgi:hypothetical protein